MKQYSVLILCVAFLAITLSGTVFAENPTNSTHLQGDSESPPASSTNSSDVKAEVKNTKIPFVQNEGQTDPQVKYYADTFYGTAYVTNDSIVHAVKGPNNTTQVIKEQFLDKNGNVIPLHPQGVEPGTAKVDYYLGNDSTKWKTALPTWNMIYLGELYPGIKVYLLAHGGNVEKIFQIEPGANPNDIRMLVSGADGLQTTPDGNLNILTGTGNIQLTKPVASQENQDVPAQYRLEGNNIYGFQTGNYDPQKTLTIDPTLVYSSYLGGTSFDQGNGVTVDNSGNIYVTGSTDSTNFPTTTGAFQTTNHGFSDAFVSKIAPNGQGSGDLKYSTYLGGSGGDIGNKIAVDNSGNIYVTGTTASTDFPVTPGAFQTTEQGREDAFVAKLTPNGLGSNDLKYSTYFGGSGNDVGNGIALDSSGNINIAGTTDSTNLPITPGAFQTTNHGLEDAFISKIAPNGSGAGDLKYSTYLGGSGDDEGTSIAVDNSGNIYTAGTTGSTNFPITPGAFQTTNNGNGDAFVSKLTPSGLGASDLKYSTFLGGSGNDEASGIAIDSIGNIYTAGFTNSPNFPTTPGAFQTTPQGMEDAFVSEIAPNGLGSSDLKYSTYLGGSGDDLASGIAVDPSNIFVTGSTSSPNFPVTPDAFQSTFQGLEDIFVSEIAPNGLGASDLKYSTYIGGTGTDVGNAIAVGSNGNIYITGITDSLNFPVTPGAFQTTFQGGEFDAFVVELATVIVPPIPSTIVINGTILSPSQTQTQNQAQAQTQTSDNSNTNNLTNNNVNIADSISTATNSNSISNSNVFNPVIILNNANYAGNS